MPASFRLTFKGPTEADVAALVEPQRAALARRMRRATEDVTRNIVLEPLRAQVRGAFKSRKLPTTWRARTYPADESSTSLSPAGFVWSQAPQIMLAFDAGATIRPVNGARFLWIPTENVAVLRGGKRADPKTTERKVGKFAFAPTKNGNVVAYARVVRRAARRHARGAGNAPKRFAFAKAPTSARALKAAKVEQVVFYVLVKQVTLKKRLDIAAVADRARTAFPAALQAAVDGAA